MPETPTRISDVLEPWAHSTPDHPAIVEPSGTWTYRQLSAAITETESWLREKGVRAGDRVMIVGENCRAFAAVLLAANRMDAWPVVVNAHLSAREIDGIRDHCEPRRIVYTTAISPHATEHAKRHAATIETVGDLGVIGLSPLNDTTQPEPLDADIAHRVAALIYTSGSTGLPKGVMLTNRNLLFTAAGSATIRSLTPDDHLYGILPLSHVVDSPSSSSDRCSAAQRSIFRALRSHGRPRHARQRAHHHQLGVPSMFSNSCNTRKSAKSKRSTCPRCASFPAPERRCPVPLKRPSNASSACLSITGTASPNARPASRKCASKIRRATTLPSALCFPA